MRKSNFRIGFFYETECFDRCSLILFSRLRLHRRNRHRVNDVFRFTAA